MPSENSFDDLARDYLMKNYKPPRFFGLKRQLRSIVRFPKNKYYDLRAFYQRGTRGWSDRDCWDLDGYLARVMGDSIGHLAETTHGWPSTDEFPKYTDWQKELREVAAKLRAYDTDRWTSNSFEENQKVYDEFTEALGRASKWWGHLWD